jgi:hypothetical protein
MEISGELIGEFRTAVGSDVSNSLGDDDCIRFLRARNGNITKASAMATTWYEWWHTSLSGSNAEDLTPATILTQIDYQWDSVMKEYCPHSFEGWDKQGRPIYWVCFPFPPPLLSSPLLTCCQLCRSKLDSSQIILERSLRQCLLTI